MRADDVVKAVRDLRGVHKPRWVVGPLQPTEIRDIALDAIAEVFGALEPTDSVATADRYPASWAVSRAGGHVVLQIASPTSGGALELPLKPEDARRLAGALFDVAASSA